MLPNGGKSKASQSKQQQTLGAIINGMMKALTKDKKMPTRSASTLSSRRNGECCEACSTSSNKEATRNRNWKVVILC
jgi:hypothetical protein